MINCRSHAESSLRAGASAGGILAVVIAVCLHGLMFIFDVSSNYAPFLRGDRSFSRFDSLRRFASSQLAERVEVMTTLPLVPGEYLFIYPSYAMGGVSGVIVFQVILHLLAVVCVIRLAHDLLPWRSAPLILGLAYALLPNNLVFSHQLVTEAVATPLVVFFIYSYHCLVMRPHLGRAIISSMFLGAAILIRPSLVLILPAVLIIQLMTTRHLRPGSLFVWSAVVSFLALIPFSIWVATYSSYSGKFGYTSGVANLQWNLRSKVFLVHSKNNLSPPPEIRAYQVYDDLYRDNSGISVGRFSEIAWSHPLAFLRGALLDGIIVSGRANTSKIFVDYLAVGDRDAFKDWRRIWSEKGVQGLFPLLRESWLSALTVVLELIGSIFVLAASASAIVFGIIVVTRGRSVSSSLGHLAYASATVNIGVLLAVLASAQIVDQAQGRLRHPAELSILLLVSFAILFVYQRVEADNKSISDV